MTNTSGSTATEFGLAREHLAAIRRVLAGFPEISKAVLYGSRAMGTFRDNSDIDITLFTQGTERSNLLFEVMGAVDELELIYGFDISLYNDIDNTNLTDHIQRVGVELYNAQQYQKEQHRESQRMEYAAAGHQSEAKLEEELITRLVSMGYERVNITNADELHANLKRQLERHNADAIKGKALSDGEFARVLNHLNSGSVFQRAEKLRDRFDLTRDDGTVCYLQFLNCTEWCQNQYQVTHQITQHGKYENRYDVTLLINGLPLVQIELKRRGIELKEAFNQINRYQRHSFWAEGGLFNYVQLFVISNGVNTKYYANNRKQDFKQTFYWADKENNLITQLDQFTDVFLEKCHVSKMISKYTVLHQSDKILMVLRPYQYYAVEAIVDRVKEGRKNGYIWHTTGSGKTLTSFKAAQILRDIPKIDKVVFVVDRADLDYQTTKEFNYFSPGCVDGTDNTRQLVEQMAGNDKMIVTTIQKLNTAITRTRHEAAMDALRDKRVVFIFDECHRSQFGETHLNITRFFTKAQMFGFTGTPIFADNATSNSMGKRTTKDLFGECLHKYVITNAIADENVLKFSVEYWGLLKKKDGTLKEESDEQVEGINTKEWYESDKRVNDITDWIIANHDRKTHNRHFSAMMCVSSKELLMKYYEAFKAKKEAGKHDLRVVTIFTYTPNEEDEDANGLISEPDMEPSAVSEEAKHSRDKLAGYVADYNAMYGTNQSVKDGKAFYTYYKDIAKRMKERDKESFQDRDRADILLVVNMFLTGFDAKRLNTLYVDKNLKYHGLIQAFSRTNRILGELKSQGNIVCFRNLKKNTDQAIKLFCDTNANEDVLMEPYEFYTETFNHGVERLKALAETPDAVNELQSEDAQAAFVQEFRNLIRTLNKARSFVDFKWQDLGLTEQTFEDYKSKYLDIYDRTRNNDKDDGESILDDLDFELELIHRDEVNVAYILELLGDINAKRRLGKATPESDKALQDVLDLLGKEVQLRSKRDLIERFIEDYMPRMTPGQNLKDIFAGYWHKEKRRAINQLCERERLDRDVVYLIMDDYNFSGKDPLREKVFAALNYKPRLMERKAIYQRILGELKGIIEQFEDDTGLIGINEDPQELYGADLSSLTRRFGDSRVCFSDEVRYSRNATELIRFTLTLPVPYEQGVASLQAYPAGGELIGRGVINDDIFTQYLQVTQSVASIFAEYGAEFADPDTDQQTGLLWTLTEAREGSTVLEFVLQAWGYSAAIAGPVGALLAAYPRMADGWERIKKDLSSMISRNTKDSYDPEKPVSLILDDQAEHEFKLWLEERDRSKGE